MKFSSPGDANPYRPWLNAPMALTLFTHNVLDENYHFGNLFYMACSQMDERHFKLKNNALWLRMRRGLSVPMRRAFFLRTGENPSWLNRLANRFFHRMGY